jgi:hypothetical protein
VWRKSGGAAVADPDRRSGRGALRQRRLAAGLSMLLGALVLWLAVPRLVASAWLALRDPVLQEIDAGERVFAADLLGLVASRELALGWAENREAHDERGTALAELAFREEPQSAAERATLERAVRAISTGLAVAPAAPKDWLQLGYLLVLLEGDPNRKAAEALLASMRTGAFEAPDFLLRRLFWSLAHWRFYDAEERRQIGDQVRLVWQLAPGDLADLMLQVPDFFAPVAAALDEIPGARDQLVAAIAFATPSTAR